ncbi:MAG: ATP-binding protein, partial [Rhodothermia bacterium]|nr:ATP-binding protein [Rhodothermia bacterium]
LGRVVEGERLLSTSTRPRPGSPVYVFPNDRLRRFLGTGGDFLIGHLVGNKDLLVAADSDNKNFLPRNVGVFGTVGSGKSNTAQVLMEEAIQAGWAVVVVDVEGEYVRMNEPSTDEKLMSILAEDYGIKGKGIPDFHVYHPTSGTSAASDPIPFKVPLSALDPEIVVDILEFSEAEMRVYGMAARQAALYAPEEATHDEFVRPYDLQNLIDGLMETKGLSGNAVRLLPLSNSDDVLTAGVVRSKLQHLGNSNILDWNKTKDVPELPISELLIGGRLSVLDVSETDDRSRNLAIAYVLQRLFQRVIDIPRGQPMENGLPRPPVLVVIEEVHTFVSRAAASKMKALLDNLQVISRRGRKRWMALALISQQPNHVPDEMFELANTRFIHQIKSMTNLQPVKETTGAVDENLWMSVPAIEPGRCLLAGAAFKTPLFMDVRPARSRRMLVH